MVVVTYFSYIYTQQGTGLTKDSASACRVKLIRPYVLVSHDNLMAYKSLNVSFTHVNRI